MNRNFIREKKVKGLLKIKGFTLIELLVIISVIGFLATAALAMLNNARVKARNFKRNGDIVQLIKAFQLAADNAGGVLPATDTSGGVCVSASCSGHFGNPPDDPEVNQFIEPYIKKPVDPGGATAANLDPRQPAIQIKGYVYFNSDDGANLRWMLEGAPASNTTCGPGYGFYFLNNYFCRADID